MHDVKLANTSNISAVFANSIDIIARYGRINLEQVACIDIRMEGRVGDIKFRDLDAQNIAITSKHPGGSDDGVNGVDMRGNIIGKQSDFSVISHTDSGKNNLSNQAGDRNENTECIYVLRQY